MILTGRYGEVHYKASGAGTLTRLLAIKSWKGDFKTEFEDVTCFGNTNLVWLPGLINIAGSFGGFWDSADLTLFEAAVAPTPGTLKLVPNSTEPLFYWTGPAYLDASIDCSLQAPKVAGNFRAAGNWTGPEQAAAMLAGAGGSLAARG